MKTAILTMALIASATFASAQEETIDPAANAENYLESTPEEFDVVESGQAWNGQLEIITEQDGVYTLSLVNCLPLLSAVLDEGTDPSELSGSHEGVILEEMLRGSTRHAIASDACGIEG